MGMSGLFGAEDLCRGALGSGLPETGADENPSGSFGRRTGRPVRETSFRSRSAKASLASVLPVKIEATACLYTSETARYLAPATAEGRATAMLENSSLSQPKWGFRR